MLASGAEVVIVISNGQSFNGEKVRDTEPWLWRLQRQNQDRGSI